MNPPRQNHPGKEKSKDGNDLQEKTIIPRYEKARKNGKAVSRLSYQALRRRRITVLAKQRLDPGSLKE